MKKMGLVVAIFFGTILLTSTVVIALPGLMEPLSTDPNVTFTGTPADSYPDIQRDQFCGVGTAKSTSYVTEYKIPTECTNPLAITTDYDGTVWFMQSNTGMVAKFDPISESFTEFENPIWPDGARSSMMWGMDYGPDGSIWFTDDLFNAIWKFSTLDESYSPLGLSNDGSDSLPQKIEVFGSNLLLNDFSGGNLMVVTPLEDEASLLMIPQLLNGSVTSDFATDADKNIWFTSWVFPDSGILAKFDYGSYSLNPVNSTVVLSDYIDMFSLPADATTINGVDLAADGSLWLADTSSSSFFMFDPVTLQFTKFVTSDPHLSTYGNATGIIKTPVSRPYWIQATDAGKIVFNESNANRLGVFDPADESLVEYMVPSKNPNWADCGDMVDCGISQVFDFAVYGEKIWFTEWVENNIGVVDTSKTLPFGVELDTDFISVLPGGSDDVMFTIMPAQAVPGLQPTGISSDDIITVTVTQPESFHLNDTSPVSVPVMISVGDGATPGQYKVLLGAWTDEVSVGKFLTVMVP